MTAEWHTPITWAVDQLVTNEDLNEQVRDNLEFLYERPVTDYILIRDEKTQNTSGGTFTSGAWQTRDLNTEVQDDGNHATLSSNQIMLETGTYYFRISAPAYQVGAHQIRLQNISDASTIALGTSQRSGTAEAVVTRSMVSGVVTIAAAKTFEVQHYCQSTNSTDGYGLAANFDTEVYTIAEFWKVK